MLHRSTSAALLGIALACAIASPARAQGQPTVDDATRSAARTLGEAGIELYRSGDHGGALAQFDRAEALVKMPTLSVRAARCLEKMGRLVEASERYLSTTALAIDERLPPAYQEAQRKAQAEAAAERALLLPRIPTLLITTEHTTIDSLTLDGRSMPVAALGVKRPIDPGVHEIEARRGSVEVKRFVTVVEGGSAELNLDLTPAAQATSSPRATALPRAPIAAPTLAPSAAPGAPDVHRSQPVIRTAAWVGVAVGAVAAGLGLGALGVALSQQAELGRLCSGASCDPAVLGESGRSAYDTYHAARTMALVGLISGVTLAAGGTVALVLTSPAAPRDRKVTVRVAPAFGGLTVRGEL